MGKFFNFVMITCSGVCVGVCIYFDYQRHQDPLFRKKLIERRRKLRLLKKLEAENRKSHSQILHMEFIQEQEAVILRQIQLAESFMENGQTEKAVIHFANAIAVASNPKNLIAALCYSLPPHAFELLVELLYKSYGNRFSWLKEENTLKVIMAQRSLMKI